MFQALVRRKSPDPLRHEPALAPLAPGKPTRGASPRAANGPTATPKHPRCCWGLRPSRGDGARVSRPPPPSRISAAQPLAVSFGAGKPWSGPSPAPRDEDGCSSSFKPARAGSPRARERVTAALRAELGLSSPPSTRILPLPTLLSPALDADSSFHVVQTQNFFGCQGLRVTCRLGSVCILDHKGTENAAQNVYGIFRPRQICSTLRAPV